MDRFDTNLFRFKYARDVARAIVAHDHLLTEDQAKALHRVITEIRYPLVDEPFLYDREPVGDLLLDVFSRAPRELVGRFQAVEASLWRFGPGRERPLERSGPSRRGGARLPYRPHISDEAVIAAYTRIRQDESEKIAVMRVDDFLVPRLVRMAMNTFKLIVGQPSYRHSYGVADYNSGYVLAKGGYGARADINMRLLEELKGVNLFPALQHLGFVYEEELDLVAMQTALGDPIFEALEPYARHVEATYVDVRTLLSSTPRPDNEPLIYHFRGHRAVEVWEGLPQVADMWRMEATIPDGPEKDAGFNKLLQGLAVAKDAMDPTRDYTEVFIRGASDIHRIDPEGSKLILDHLPKNERMPGATVDFMTTGFSALGILRSMYHNVAGTAMPPIRPIR